MSRIADVTLLEEILLNVPCPIFWKDKKGAFLGCNKLFLQVTGFKDYKELIGKIDKELFWSEFKEEYARDDAEVTYNGKTITRIEKIPLNGKTIISETTKTPLMQKGKIIGVLGICNDITARIEAEELNIELARKEAIISEQGKFKNIIDKLFQVLNEYKYFGEENHQITTIELTKREKQILHYLSLNKNPKEIGLILNITGNTVQSIINKRLFVKLGVNSIGRLIEEAVKNKLITFTLDDE